MKKDRDSRALGLSQNGSRGAGVLPKKRKGCRDVTEEKKRVQGCYRRKGLGFYVLLWGLVCLSLKNIKVCFDKRKARLSSEPV